MEAFTIKQEWLTSAQAAKYLHMHPGSLANLRSQRSGPPWYRPRGSRMVRYRRSELDRWLESGRISA